MRNLTQLMFILVLGGCPAQEPIPAQVETEVNPAVVDGTVDDSELRLVITEIVRSRCQGKSDAEIMALMVRANDLRLLGYDREYAYGDIVLSGCNCVPCAQEIGFQVFSYP